MPTCTYMYNYEARDRWTLKVTYLCREPVLLENTERGEGLEIIPQLSDNLTHPTRTRERETNLPRRSPFRLLMVAMAT